MLTLGTFKMSDERSPFGQYMLAEEFRRVGKELANDPMHEAEFPRAFCLCHAVELLLKSFLGARGWTERQLKQRRHDLSQILEGAPHFDRDLGPDRVVVGEFPASSAEEPDARELALPMEAAHRIIALYGSASPHHAVW